MHIQKYTSRKTNTK